jgi:hypothetical protein
MNTTASLEWIAARTSFQYARRAINTSSNPSIPSESTKLSQPLHRPFSSRVAGQHSLDQLTPHTEAGVQQPCKRAWQINRATLGPTL